MMMRVVNTEVINIPNLMRGEHHASALAILTMDDVGMYAVYVGIVSLRWHPDLDQEEWSDMKMSAANVVMHRGLKLRYRAALNYFPFLPEDGYRH